MERLKRIAAINDISCFGKCSLTVALPVVSATGVECAVLPTVLLSTHTAVFEGYTYRDLTGEMAAVAEHWKREGLHFDGICAGYMAGPGQVGLAGRVINELKTEDTLVVVDPAMADHGRYYAGLGEDMASAFRELIAGADVVTPNVTEAAFLTGMPYSAPPHSRDYIRALCEKLAFLGPKVVTVTGVQIGKNALGAVAFDGRTGERFVTMRAERPGAFHGSGDLFAAAYAALLVRGAGVGRALETAVALVAESIERTDRRGTPRHYGLDFEGALPDYIRRVEEIFGD